MLTLSDVIYYLIFLTATILSFKARPQNIPGLFILRWMLCVGFINEIIAELLQHLALNDNIAHHFYIPLEYVLMVFFLKANTKKGWLKKLLLLSIVPYLSAALLLTFYVYKLATYPSGIYNLNCGLTTIWISLILLDLENINNMPIISLPLFWILTGFLVFYSGIFFFNGAYNYFMITDSALAKTLRIYINTVLNNILYVTLSYAFIYSWKIRKYSYR